MNVFTKLMTVSLLAGVSLTANASTVSNDLLDEIQSRVSENIQTSIVELKINTKKALVDSFVRINEDAEAPQTGSDEAKKEK
ncbi:hypothetical protein [Pseudoalteromonas luteoviolacea]|uniref:Uncharacterized protein n=1 Tax=Pseudoalteromonas luteoviolacea DSM 6061 TaxID=1365250 RepID=A0A166WQD2_9GAMM|nr:hypothetical protein [Pseudoalteromonas luteoviolacea]KZN37748.1 hypothetical protein N475_02730 [Pseudoalteromonas luteoviolacea DSM 6061]KZN60661.1 hypothetical protein N474_00335 [Pseudoalteromonas luteoviolacea CPMOR-2]MBE0386827.1 hypothetical protein [Pseudoalteromonas luteoviolacea DSM 6061]TQF71653.1 hypothetical protein FLM44_11455 [Pseudoalteromonas luteoviolacea]